MDVEQRESICSKQNFKLAQCVLLSLLCCLIKEIMKLEIRKKRKKAYLDLFCFFPVSTVY